MDNVKHWIFRLPSTLVIVWCLTLVTFNDAGYYCSLFHGHCSRFCGANHRRINITDICVSPESCCVLTGDEPTERNLPSSNSRQPFKLPYHKPRPPQQTALWNFVPIAATTTTPKADSGIRPAVVCGVTGHSRVRRVVNGLVARECQYPWMVLINRGGGPSDTCGAALVSNKHLITAAHCFDKLKGKRPTIVIGEYDREEITLSEFRTTHYSVDLHPNYDDSLYRNDIAIVTLDTAIDFSAHECLRPICLPEEHTSLPVGTRCVVAGWGSTRREVAKVSQILRGTFIKVVEPSTCRKVWFWNFFPKTHICAGDLTGITDSCEGDSGGPLMCHDVQSTAEVKDTFYLFGVVSLGAMQCAQVDVPAMYTDVRKYLPWIQKTMNITNVTK